MKLISRLVAVLLGVFWMGVALRMVLPAIKGGEAWTAFAIDVEGGRATGLALSVLTIVGFLAWIASIRAKPAQPRYLSYETEHGAISISLKALQDFLGNLKDEYPAVLALAPKVNAQEDGLNILLEVDVRAGESVPDLSRSMQDRVRKLIEEKVGVSEIKNIEVRVEEIVNEKPSATQKVEPVPPPAGEVP